LLDAFSKVLLPTLALVLVLLILVMIVALAKALQSAAGALHEHKVAA